MPIHTDGMNLNGGVWKSGLVLPLLRKFSYPLPVKHNIKTEASFMMILKP
jgi:hypothetical protein